MIDKNKKYKTRSGCEVRIYATDGYGNYPIHGAVKNDCGTWTLRAWSNEGEFSTNKSAYDLIEVSPYEDFKIDDKVLVWNEGDCNKFKRYFAGIDEKGRPLFFQDGTTSWSTIFEPVCWDYCEKVCDE